MRTLRSPSGLGFLGLGLVLSIGFAVGCTGTEESGESTDAVIQGKDPKGVAKIDEAAELDTILGDDRVARILKANPTKIPDHLDEFEATFGVGRKCNRTDSKEIWTAEEKDTRVTGDQVETPDLTPRLVIGGCNQHPSTVGSERETFDMMVAMTSIADRPLGDMLPNEPVEIMALDSTTGLYNFYVLEPAATEGGNGTVTRFVRGADDVVEKWQKVEGKAATKELFPQRKCFNCHIHGEPVMNELTEPWTNWVSSRKTISRNMSGMTRELVSESRPFDSEHNRSSLANQLEQITRAAIATWVEGTPSVPGSGFGAQVLAGKQPGGASALLRSVFCETLPQYATVFDTAPIALFMDGQIAGMAAIEPPIPPVSGADWTLLPVRGEADVRIERFLQKQKILTPDTVLAVRIFDDMQDIFSAKRCALHADATSRLDGNTPEQAVRASILAALDADDAARATGATSTTTKPQREYLRALLGTNVTQAKRDAAEAAYVVDVTARFQKEAAKLDTEDGLAELSKRWTDRQASARAMFPRAANPLPLTHAPAESVATATPKP